MTEEFNPGGYIPPVPHVIPALTWRVIGKADPSEVWVPLPAGRHSSVTLLLETARYMGFSKGGENGDK